ncbi:isochorismatase family protein [Paenalcaligenes hominis]|uniref:isochorismatase family protein n=1 Tax=Paenalcaligenes hominis TaxID=643674 RepID=UPI0035240572
MRDLDNLRGGFDGELSFGRHPALLVIDFQKGFTVPGHSALYADCNKQIESTNKIIKAMRGIGPIYFTVIAYEKNLKDGGLWLKKGRSLQQLLRNTSASELDSQLDYDRDKDTLLYKTQASAFFGTPLAALLSQSQCDSLIVAGATTSGCVRASVVDAMQNGFAPFVVADAVSDRSSQQHTSNLIDMASKYAEVVTSQEVIQKLKKLSSQV